MKKGRFTLPVGGGLCGIRHIGNGVFECSVDEASAIGRVPLILEASVPRGNEFPAELDVEIFDEPDDIEMSRMIALAVFVENSKRMTPDEYWAQQHSDLSR